MRFGTWVTALTVMAWTATAGWTNPGYGGKCFQCHVSGDKGGSGDLNGVGAKYARDGHKFPEEDKKKEEEAKKEGGEGSAEGSGATTSADAGAGGSEGGSGATTGAAGGEGGAASGDGGGGGGGGGSSDGGWGGSSGGGGDSGTSGGTSGGGGSSYEGGGASSSGGSSDYGGSSGSSSGGGDNSPAIEGPSGIVGSGAQVAQAGAGGDAAGAAAADSSGGGGASEGGGDPYAKYQANGKKVFSLVSPKLSSVQKSCATCHGNDALAGKWPSYPKFRSELKKVVTIEQAIQWCMENNMKGKSLALDSAYMVALSVYLKELKGK